MRKAELLQLPLHSQLREKLRERILDGTYTAHQQLPTESELTRAFGVSRITVRQALSDLQKEGLLFKIRGKGSFVSKPKAFQDLARLQGFGEAMHRHGHEIYNKLIAVKMLRPPREVAARLLLRPAEAVCELRRVRYLNREPISLDVTYVRRDLGERLAKEDLATRDIFSIIENDYATPLGEAELRIEATTAEAALGRLLRIDEGAPVLRIERLTRAADGTPIDFEYLYYRGDAFQYRVRVDRAPA